MRDLERYIYGDEVANIAIGKDACEACVMLMIRRFFHTLGSCIREGNQLFGGVSSRVSYLDDEAP